MMKTKNGTQTITHRLLKYLPLLIALGIVGAWIGLIQYVSHFPNRHDGTVLFYPLAQLASHVDLESCIIICLLLLILHGIAIVLDISKIFVVLSLIQMSALVIFWLFLGWLQVSRLEDYDTKAVNSHLYRLVHIPNDIWGYSTPVQAYSVLECDASGLWCEYYSTPYLKEHYQFSDFPKEAHLGIDPLTHRLLLHVGQDIIDVEATDHFEICNELYKQHTDRNRNIDYQGYVCS